MLSRAAQRAAKAPIAHFSTSARFAAKPSRFVPAGSAAPKPAKKAAPTPAARQTSPGTSLPKDKTWKPTDSIKFAAPAAAATQPIRPSADGSVATDASASTAASPSANTAPTQQPGPNAKTTSSNLSRQMPTPLPQNSLPRPNRNLLVPCPTCAKVFHPPLISSS
jgi:import inner membrane translocase subunit TIM50